MKTRLCKKQGQKAMTMAVGCKSLGARLIALTFLPVGSCWKLVSRGWHHENRPGRIDWRQRNQVGGHCKHFEIRSCCGSRKGGMVLRDTRIKNRLLLAGCRQRGRRDGWLRETRKCIEGTIRKKESTSSGKSSWVERKIDLLSIDYLIGTVEFLSEIGKQEVAHWLKMTIPGNKCWLTQDGRVEKALWSRVNPGPNWGFFSWIHCMYLDKIKFSGPDSLSVKWEI